jgi:hypothetical protein
MSIRSDLVLDAALRRREAWDRTRNHSRRNEMFDPAVLGTLLIGLESVRHEGEIAETRRRRAVQATRRPARHAIAGALRSIANALEAPVASPGATAGSR